MRFSAKLYPYQEEILKVFESERDKGEKKIHIVAPPGSGKTIIGCEILSRLSKPTLILVPNLTLLEQWQDKLEKLFFESGETREGLISTSIEEIKHINILTYQSLAGSDDAIEEIEDQIYALWYESEKNEFSSKELFLDFIHELKIQAKDEFSETYAKHRKKLKNSGDSDTTRKMMREKIHAYTKKLNEYGVELMIVDEAHHLTSWWSHVLFEIWKNLDEPYIVGLTATPPFDDVDYFELDESYTKLLGSVDYFVPTPAIVKSGRLAPYSDLLYIVSPGKELEAILQNREQKLKVFLETHHEEIVLFLHKYLSENYERLKIQSGDLCDKWMRFIYHYKNETVDMSPYIHGGINENITLEDIAKSIGKWTSDSFKKDFDSATFESIKSLFFELGYIWRGANLYRFETPLEKGLIYAKSKIEGVRAILKKEEENLGSGLRVAIIADFLDVNSDWINCHAIFDAIAKDFPHLSPYIVSGQGIWKLENGNKVLAEDETILTVTEKLSRGETLLVIGTRGILGEGWDCPKVNTLIDLTGVSAYMSVNQVHGRAIRLDPNMSEKVANIYDIVCVGEGYQGLRDFERLQKKHEQFYGVDDAGLVIKGLDHIYPQLEKNVRNVERLNAYALKKSSLRPMVKELWNVGEEFKNEEIFSLSIEIKNPFELYPINKNVGFFSLIGIDPLEKEHTNILEIGKSKYHALVREYIKNTIDASLQVLLSFEVLPFDFTYTLKWTDTGTITILGKHKDALIEKKFIEILSEVFGPITDQKYKYVIRVDAEHFSQVVQKNPDILFVPGIMATVPLGLFLSFGFLPYVYLDYGILLSIIGGITGPYYLAKQKLSKKGIQLLLLSSGEITLGLPEIIASNETKRGIFTGELAPKGWRWIFRNSTKLSGEIQKVEKGDIGKPTYFSTKIEKLWI